MIIKHVERKPSKQVIKGINYSLSLKRVTGGEAQGFVAHRVYLSVGRSADARHGTKFTNPIYGKYHGGFWYLLLKMMK